MSQTQQSLRYAASLQLHQLDSYVGSYHQARVELVSMLDRLITATTQYNTVLRLRQARRTTTASGGDRALVLAEARVSETRLQLESTLDKMRSTASGVSTLSAMISQSIGQIGSDPTLSAYSSMVDSATFNDEYRELQRAADVIRQQDSTLKSDIQIKVMQYSHCATSEHRRLLATWNATLTAKDSDMDDLADMMLS